MSPFQPRLTARGVSPLALRPLNIDEVVDEDDIAAVVAQWTGIPVAQMLETESEKLLHMEERLHDRIVGQNEAIEALSDAIRRARSGLKDPSRPIGSFIFLGSSVCTSKKEAVPR